MNVSSGMAQGHARHHARVPVGKLADALQTGLRAAFSSARTDLYNALSGAPREHIGETGAASRSVEDILKRIGD